MPIICRHLLCFEAKSGSNGRVSKVTDLVLHHNNLNKQQYLSQLKPYLVIHNQCSHLLDELYDLSTHVEPETGGGINRGCSIM